MNQKLGILIITSLILLTFLVYLGLRTLKRRHETPTEVNLLNFSLDEHIFHKNFTPVHEVASSIGRNIVRSKKKMYKAAPTPTTAQTPTPAPTTAQTPTPAPTTAQTPTPTTTTEPTPAPTTAQTPTPTTTQTPTPAPTTEPTPAPTTEPTPAPTTEPTLPKTQAQTQMPQQTPSENINNEIKLKVDDHTISPTKSKLTSALSSIPPENVIRITPSGFKIIKSGSI